MCNVKFEYLFYNVGYFGKYECLMCGYKNFESRFVIINIREDLVGFVFDFVDRERDIYIENIKWKIGGVYNLYNVCVVILVVMLIGVEEKRIKERIEIFENKFGRLEKKEVDSKKVIILFVKNFIGMSEILSVISNDFDFKVIVFIFNDNVVDGKDILWIWDVDFDILCRIENIKVLYFGGKRKEDMVLRVKYSEYMFVNFEFIDYKEELDKVFE